MIPGDCTVRWTLDAAGEVHPHGGNRGSNAPRNPYLTGKIADAHLGKGIVIDHLISVSSVQRREVRGCVVVLVDWSWLTLGLPAQARAPGSSCTQGESEATRVVIVHTGMAFPPRPPMCSLGRRREGCETSGSDDDIQHILLPIPSRNLRIRPAPLRRNRRRAVRA